MNGKCAVIGCGGVLMEPIINLGRPVVLITCPKEKILREEWIRRVNRPDLALKEVWKVCSLHFHDNDLYLRKSNGLINSNSNIQVGVGGRLLNSAAVPCYNLTPLSLDKIFGPMKERMSLSLRKKLNDIEARKFSAKKAAVLSSDKRKVSTTPHASKSLKNIVSLKVKQQKLQQVNTVGISNNADGVIQHKMLGKGSSIIEIDKDCSEEELDLESTYLILCTSALELPSQSWAVHLDFEDNSMLITRMIFHFRPINDRTIRIPAITLNPDIFLLENKIHIPNVGCIKSISDLENLVRRVENMQTCSNVAVNVSDCLGYCEAPFLEEKNLCLSCKEQHSSASIYNMSI